MIPRELRDELRQLTAAESGAFVGEEALGGDPVRAHTATAMTATHMIVITKTEMIRLLRAQQAVTDRLIAYVLARNTRLEADLTAQFLDSCDQRVARTLIALSGCRNGCSCECVLPDVSQAIIAEMVGTESRCASRRRRASRRVQNGTPCRSLAR